MPDRRWTPTLAIALAIVALPAAGRLAQADDHDDRFADKSVLYRAGSTGLARTFVNAVYVSGLTELLRDGGPFTVFVPTDEAFARLPEEELLRLLQPENMGELSSLLQYHVLPGKFLADELTANPRPETVADKTLTIAANSHGIAVNEATIVKADLEGRNGVIHLIDRVLMPPSDGVLDVARQAGSFTILVKAIEEAGLADALSGDGPFTVLAPTDEAFSKLGTKKIAALLKDRATLAAILKYHVLPGKRSARALVRLEDTGTLLGQQVRPDIDSGRLVINGVKVLDTDIEASNGIIHVIDEVLIPDQH